MFRWIYRLSDGEFLYGGPYRPEYDPGISGAIDLPHHPDVRTERYDSAGGIRPATVQEMADFDAAQTNARANGHLDGDKLVKALAIWTAQRLNVPLATARQEILMIVKTL